MTNEPREWTEDEIREQFLAHVRSCIEYWDRTATPKGCRDRLEGLAFSIMVALDGGAYGVPGFIVAPCPHADDRQFNIDNGENWYPENGEVESVKGDIGGCLHELLFRREDP